MNARFLSSALLLALLPGASAESPSPLGKIGKVELHASEIQESLAGLEARQDSPIDRSPAALSQYVRAILVQKRILDELKSQKWDQNPEVITELVRVRESTLTESFLKSVSRPPADFPPADLVANAYEQAKSSLKEPERFRLAQIFVAKSPQASSPTTKVKEITTRLAAANADFAKLARELSEDSASAHNGGEIGWLTPSQLQPEIRKHLPSLAKGKTSTVIELDDGWHWLHLLDHQAERTLTLDEVKPRLIAELRTLREQELRRDYLRELLEREPIVINEIELSRLFGSASR